MPYTVRISILNACGCPLALRFPTSILVTVLYRYGAWTRTWWSRDFL